VDSKLRLRGTALFTAVLLASEGCSALFVREGPRHATLEEPDCTSSAAAPIADSVVAIGGALLTTAGLGATIECHQRGNCAENAGPLALILGTVALGVAGASAIYGFRQTRRCREATASWCSSHDCGVFAMEPPQPAR
jgi:hypothetical protein